jgi:hypothetical protein
MAVAVSVGVAACALGTLGAFRKMRSKNIFLQDIPTYFSECMRLHGSRSSRSIAASADAYVISPHATRGHCLYRGPLRYHYGQRFLAVCRGVLLLGRHEGTPEEVIVLAGAVVSVRGAIIVVDSSWSPPLLLWLDSEEQAQSWAINLRHAGILPQVKDDGAISVSGQDTRLKDAQIADLQARFSATLHAAVERSKRINELQDELQDRQAREERIGEFEEALHLAVAEASESQERLRTLENTLSAKMTDSVSSSLQPSPRWLKIDNADSSTSCMIEEAMGALEHMLEDREGMLDPASVEALQLSLRSVSRRGPTLDVQSADLINRLVSALKHPTTIHSRLASAERSAEQQQEAQEEALQELREIKRLRILEDGRISQTEAEVDELRDRLRAAEKEKLEEEYKCQRLERRSYDEACQAELASLELQLDRERIENELQRERARCEQSEERARREIEAAVGKTEGEESEKLQALEQVYLKEAHLERIQKEKEHLQTSLEKEQAQLCSVREASRREVERANERADQQHKQKVQLAEERTAALERMAESERERLRAQKEDRDNATAEMEKERAKLAVLEAQGRAELDAERKMFEVRQKETEQALQELFAQRSGECEGTALVQEIESSQSQAELLSKIEEKEKEIREIQEGMARMESMLQEQKLQAAHELQESYDQTELLEQRLAIAERTACDHAESRARVKTSLDVLEKAAAKVHDRGLEPQAIEEIKRAKVQRQVQLLEEKLIGVEVDSKSYDMTYLDSPFNSNIHQPRKSKLSSASFSYMNSLVDDASWVNVSYESEMALTPAPVTAAPAHAAKESLSFCIDPGQKPHFNADLSISSDEFNPSVANLEKTRSSLEKRIMAAESFLRKAAAAAPSPCRAAGSRDMVVFSNSSPSASTSPGDVDEDVEVDLEPIKSSSRSAAPAPAHDVSQLNVSRSASSVSTSPGRRAASESRKWDWQQVSPASAQKKCSELGEQLLQSMEEVSLLRKESPKLNTSTPHGTPLATYSDRLSDRDAAVSSRSSGPRLPSAREAHVSFVLEEIAVKHTTDPRRSLPVFGNRSSPSKAALYGSPRSGSVNVPPAREASPRVGGLFSRGVSPIKLHGTYGASKGGAAVQLPRSISCASPAIQPRCVGREASIRPHSCSQQALSAQFCQPVLPGVQPGNSILQGTARAPQLLLARQESSARLASSSPHPAKRSISPQSLSSAATPVAVALAASATLKPPGVCTPTLASIDRGIGLVGPPSDIRRSLGGQQKQLSRNSLGITGSAPQFPSAPQVPSAR